MLRIQLSDRTVVEVDTLPDECPYCHKSIIPVRYADNILGGYIELIFKCPNSDCNKSFISTYESNYSGYHLFLYSNVGRMLQYPFSNEINLISPSFVIIYNEAFFAEQHSLFQICGVGYRKALEFLIKDYLVKLKPEKENIIKEKFLGNCIKDDVDDVRIKKVAERAVWLGNDETHYVRLWEESSLADLKKLIELTVHWIEMEELTNTFDVKMPKGKR